MFRDRFPIAGKNGEFHLMDKSNWVTTPYIAFSNRIEGTLTTTVSPHGLLKFQFETNRLDGSLKIWLRISRYRSSDPIIVSKDELHDLGL